MLIKIGDAWVDPEEIVGIAPEEIFEIAPEEVSPYGNSNPIIYIQMRGSTGSLCAHTTMDEAEAALIDAGLIENPYPEEDEAPELSSEEREELAAFDAQGFSYLARDEDGKVFAYKEKPALEDGYFFSPGATQPVQAVGAFAFLQPCDFTAIPFLLCP